jgi:hypothetical protein
VATGDGEAAWAKLSVGEGGVQGFSGGREVYP